MMKLTYKTDQAFSESSLKKRIYKFDIKTYPDIFNKNDDNQLTKSALDIAHNNFNGSITYEYKVLKTSKKETIIYSATLLQEILILRQCSINITNILYEKPKSRTKICKELKAYLQEGTPYNVYKLDIKNFFESVSIQIIKNVVKKNKRLSLHTKNLIIEYLHLLNTDSLPRGIEFSPMLAELILEPFDSKIRSLPEVIYYSRFVDDIVIITLAVEKTKAFYKKIASLLPYDLQFNYNKKCILEISSYKVSHKNKSDIQNNSFDYLGYEFKITDSISDGNSNERMKQSKHNFRPIEVNVSSKKIKSIKTKISQSFVSYKKNHNFDLLKKRLSFLSSNHYLKQKKHLIKTPTGIYYNYSLIDKHSKSLISLDKYLYSQILKKNTLLDPQQQKELLSSFSFIAGHSYKIFNKFPINELKIITKIWR